MSCPSVILPASSAVTPYHMKSILDDYGGPIHVINLLRYTTKREVRITTEFVRQVYESEFKDQIKFLNFDFHGFCGGDNYQALKVLVQKVDKDILKHGYLIENLSTKSVEQM